LKYGVFSRFRDTVPEMQASQKPASILHA